MEFYSTRNKRNRVSFREAIIKGIADDGGLFMPSVLPKLSPNFIESLGTLTFNELAYHVTAHLLADEIPSNDLKIIIDEVLTFDAPLVTLKDNVKILELFHGPTLAFKDFGARFMAKTLSYLTKSLDKEITILVATSGDTGSAVANGFYKVEGIKVILLYPSNKVSHLQEQQLTTLNGNVIALEVEGTFDDCQRLVKQAFLDEDLIKNLSLSSANSINIGRLIPQSFYYFYAYAQLQEKSLPTVISVPSGNFGNLTAGLFAKRMGLPVHKFIAATNANDVFPKYLMSEMYKPQPSIKTISNAMDVGNPSNFERILDLFDHEYSAIKDNIYSTSFTDEDTKEAMKEVYHANNYILDPHGAVGYLALKRFLVENIEVSGSNNIVLETAHPAKFIDLVEEVIGEKVEMPERLKACLGRQKKSVKISNDFNQFKNLLLNG